MSVYEVLLILRHENEKRLRSFLYNFVTEVFENKGLVMTMDNMGDKTMPHPTKRHLEKFMIGRYMAIQFVYPPHKLKQLQNSLNHNTTIIRATVSKVSKTFQQSNSSFCSDYQKECKEYSLRKEREMLNESVIIKDYETEASFNTYNSKKKI